jgi:hypothetical protein
LKKRCTFPDGKPLAFLRIAPIESERVDRITSRLRLRAGFDRTAREALKLIQDQAAHIVGMESELGLVYEGGKLNG